MYCSGHAARLNIRRRKIEYNFFSTMHRTVLDYDRILVLDHGQVVEYDRPLNLMREGGGTGHFRRMVIETGEFEELWEIARKKEEGEAGFVAL